MMARHPSIHIQVVFASLHKAAAFAELGLNVSLCGKFKS